MATVSRQSAFWAVVALGLNTFTQDGGKVLGLPAEWSRALRLSPVVCIVDTLGVLFSIAFFYYKTRSVKDGFALAARYRCLTEDDPAKPRLERTWWFRFSVFAMGALPQAVKLLGMGGIPLTKIWGMAYLVSFLVLEGLDLLQTRQHRGDHTLEKHVKALDMYMSLTGGFAVYAQAICFMSEELLIPGAYLHHQCDLKSSNSLPLPEPGNGTNRMTTLIKITPYWLLVLLSPFVLNRAISLLLGPIPGRSLIDSTEMVQMRVVLCVATAYLIGLGFLIKGLNTICPLREFFIEAAALPLLLKFFVWVFICTQRASKFRWFRNLFGMKRYERKEGSFLLTFTAGNIAGIICYYMYIYDLVSTYKPPWTEYLG